eukprot:Hpha_TRINITY_DN4057_c0_g1::TRINITY_DN4057_c0_g1_i1::g.63811::m.63811
MVRGGPRQDSSASKRVFRRFATRVARDAAGGKLRLGREACRVVGDFAHDIFLRLAREAGGLVNYSGGTRMSARAVQSATRLVLNGELARHAVLAGQRAVAHHRIIASEPGVHRGPRRSGPPGSTPPPARRRRRVESDVHSAPTAAVSLATPHTGGHHAGAVTVRGPSTPAVSAPAVAVSLATPHTGGHHAGAVTVRGLSTPAVSGFGALQPPLASTAAPSTACVAAWMASASPVFDEEYEAVMARGDSQSAESNPCCQFCGGAVPSDPLGTDHDLAHGTPAGLTPGARSGPCGLCNGAVSPAPVLSTPCIDPSVAPGPQLVAPDPHLVTPRFAPADPATRAPLLTPTPPDAAAGFFVVRGGTRSDPRDTPVPPVAPRQDSGTDASQPDRVVVKPEPFDPSVLTPASQATPWRTPRAGRSCGNISHSPVPPVAVEACAPVRPSDDVAMGPAGSSPPGTRGENDDCADATTEHGGPSPAKAHEESSTHSSIGFSMASRNSRRQNSSTHDDTTDAATSLGDPQSPATEACGIPLPDDSLTLQCSAVEKSCFTEWRNLAPPWSATAPTREDVPGWDAFLIRAAFSPAEMQVLIAAAEARGFGRLGGSAGACYRQHLRLTCVDESLAEAVGERLGHLFPQEVTDEEGRRWVFLGLNQQWRISKYNPGDRFAAHCNRCYERGSWERAMYAVRIYMSGGHDGGRTLFFSPGASTPAFAVLPEPGKAIVHRLPPARSYLHEEETLLCGTKYVLRTEAMYHLYPRRGLPAP